MGQYCWFSVLGLKDTFPCIPTAEEPLQLSAFWWQDSETQGVQQYCWTVLPQGFRDSPHLFRQASAKDLAAFHTTESIKVLQYVDDILLCADTEKICYQATCDNLNLATSSSMWLS